MVYSNDCFALMFFLSLKQTKSQCLSGVEHPVFCSITVHFRLYYLMHRWYFEADRLWYDMNGSYALLFLLYFSKLRYPFPHLLQRNHIFSNHRKIKMFLEKYKSQELKCCIIISLYYIIHHSASDKVNHARRNHH